MLTPSSEMNVCMYVCIYLSIHPSIYSVIIPLLAELSLQNNEAPNLTQRKDVAHMLLEAYRGVSGCCIHMYYELLKFMMACM